MRCGNCTKALASGARRCFVSMWPRAVGFQDVVGLGLLAEDWAAVEPGCAARALSAKGVDLSTLIPIRTPDQSARIASATRSAPRPSQSAAEIDAQ